MPLAYNPTSNKLIYSARSGLLAGSCDCCTPFCVCGTCEESNGWPNTMTIDPLVGVASPTLNTLHGDSSYGYLLGNLLNPANDPFQFSKVICCFEAEWDATAYGSCVSVDSTLKFALYSCKKPLELYYDSYSLAFESSAYAARGWIVWYVLVSYDPAADPDDDFSNNIAVAGVTIAHSGSDDPPDYRPPCCIIDTPGCDFIGGYSGTGYTGHPEWLQYPIVLAVSVSSNNHAGDPNCVDYWTQAPALSNASSITVTPGSCGTCDNDCSTCCDRYIFHYLPEDGGDADVIYERDPENDCRWIEQVIEGDPGELIKDGSTFTMTSNERQFSGTATAVDGCPSTTLADWDFDFSLHPLADVDGVRSEGCA